MAFRYNPFDVAQPDYSQFAGSGQSAYSTPPVSGGSSAISPFGLLAQGIQDTINIGFGIYDRYQQKKANEQNQENWENAFNFQKNAFDRNFDFANQQFEYAKYANENALQIHTRDAQAAGLSPLTGIGAGSFSSVGGASAGGMSAGNQSAAVSSARVGIGDFVSNLLAQKNQYDIAKMETENARNIARENAESSERIAKSNNETAEAIAAANNTSRANIAELDRIAETDRVLYQLASNSEIAKNQLEELQQYHNRYLAHLKAQRKNNWQYQQDVISNANRQMQQAKEQFDRSLAHAKDATDKQIAAQRYNTTMMFWSSVIRTVGQVGSSIVTKGISPQFGENLNTDEPSIGFRYE